MLFPTETRCGSSCVSPGGCGDGSNEDGCEHDLLDGERGEGTNKTVGLKVAKHPCCSFADRLEIPVMHDDDSVREVNMLAAKQDVAFDRVGVVVAVDEHKVEGDCEERNECLEVSDHDRDVPKLTHGLQIVGQAVFSSCFFYPLMAVNGHNMPCDLGQCDG